MTEEEKRIESEAVEYIKSAKAELLRRFAPEAECHPVVVPVSLFMAGSPGAGKTEVSKGLMRRFEDMPIRIDADDIRALCPGYVGTNAHLFQKAANKGVNILYDYALERGLNCILDGTFAYEDAPQNIDRSLKRGRVVELWFVYQDPIRAWEFTKAREARETRHVSKENFIRSFIKARHNAFAVKRQFGDRIKLNLLLKDYETGEEDVRLNAAADDLDRVTDGRYSEDTLNNLLV
jgi:predicted ABC-type ATPase